MKIPDRKKNWEMRLQDLKQFREQHPGNWPRKIPGVPEEQKLFNWGNQQRDKRNLIKLTDIQLRQLNEIGFFTRKEDAWEKNYNKLLQYAEKHKRLPSYPHYLYTWYNHQRKRAKLQALQQKKIETITMNFPKYKWGKDLECWETRLEEAIAYLKEHKLERLKQDHPRLYRWLWDQWLSCRKNMLSAHKKKLIYSSGLQHNRGIRSKERWVYKQGGLKQLIQPHENYPPRMLKKHQKKYYD